MRPLKSNTASSQSNLNNVYRPPSFFCDPPPVAPIVVFPVDIPPVPPAPPSTPTVHNATSSGVFPR